MTSFLPHDHEVAGAKVPAASLLPENQGWSLPISCRKTVAPNRARVRCERLLPAGFFGAKPKYRQSQKALEYSRYVHRMGVRGGEANRLPRLFFPKQINSCQALTSDSYEQHAMKDVLSKQV